MTNRIALNTFCEIQLARVKALVAVQTPPKHVPVMYAQHTAVRISTRTARSRRLARHHQLRMAWL